MGDAAAAPRMKTLNLGSVEKVPKLPPEVRGLIQAGRKIEAIKKYRELTGAGLKEAKDTVEAAQILGA